MDDIVAQNSSHYYLILRAFELEGLVVRYACTVKDPQTAPTQQIDAAIHDGGRSYLIECKDQGEKKNIEPIAKLQYYLAQRPVETLGIVFSRHGFTNLAIDLADVTTPKRVLLWDGSEIDFALERQMMRRGLSAKYRFVVEEGFVCGDADDGARQPDPALARCGRQQIRAERIEGRQAELFVGYGSVVHDCSPLA
ncbi:MAG: restriction endonuclease [Chloroflexota bacterium]|nr:restriction endonuclease [Chloroflexota bacterium]